KMIYDKFNGSLENLFENTLELLRQAVILNKWNITHMFTIEMKNSLKKFFVKVRNCKWSPRWAMKFVTMVSIPLEALHTKLVPKNFDKSLLYNVLVLTLILYLPFRWVRFGIIVKQGEIGTYSLEFLF
ncbi:unnamed protein product, partial [Allacma fusca]